MRASCSGIAIELPAPLTSAFITASNASPRHFLDATPPGACDKNPTTTKLIRRLNLARKDKGAEPRALVLQKENILTTGSGDGVVRKLVGDGSPVELGTPGWSSTLPCPPADR